jgi:amino acid adenylation domain-containing protein
MSPVSMPEQNSIEFGGARGSTIHGQFQRQAALTPDRIAVIHRDREMSYRELDESSSRLANYLRALGVKPESKVGICMPRSEALLVGLLAILKSGGAYVPLDPAHPAARLSFVVDDSEMSVLLASPVTLAQLPSGRRGLHIVDAEAPAIPLVESVAAQPCTDRHSLAYIMYTSGTTGNPKGVMVEHGNVVNFFHGMDEVIASDPGVLLAVTSVAFDISVLELLWTVTRGFTVIIHSGGGAAAIADEIVRRRVTHLQMTPSLARMLTIDTHALAALKSLKHILLGGEALPASLVQRIRQVFNGEMLNMYGPTETTIWSTAFPVTEPGLTIPIGRPIANTKVYILDEELCPVPEGSVGELFIGGAGVARGYWKQPALTGERFLAVPLLSASRLYRTGDMVRRLPDGNLEFLGRTDHQVKLRGHRIELAEIEALLEQHPGVRQAVVLLREEREQDRRLVAYLVADSTALPSVSELRGAVAAKLPDVMVPSAFVYVPEFPLNANGKIDRVALLQFPHEPPPLSMPQDAALPNDMEQIVSRVWEEALGVKSVGLHDNFFDLGAHSLTIAEVQAKLQDVLRRDISIVDLFQFTTVSRLAQHLSGAQAKSELPDRAQRRKMARQR